MMSPASPLDRLQRQQPDWAPWLAVIEEILRESLNRSWDTVVPLGMDSGDDGLRPAGAPLLTGAALSLQASSVRKLLTRLIRVAMRDGTPEMRTLEAGVDADVEVLTIFAASLCQENARI